MDKPFIMHSFDSFDHLDSYCHNGVLVETSVFLIHGGLVFAHELHYQKHRVSTNSVRNQIWKAWIMFETLQKRDLVFIFFVINSQILHDLDCIFSTSEGLSGKIDTTVSTSSDFAHKFIFTVELLLEFLVNFFKCVNLYQTASIVVLMVDKFVLTNLTRLVLIFYYWGHCTSLIQIEHSQIVVHILIFHL